MAVRAPACAIAILAVAVTACAGRRHLPYRFRGPMVGSVSAPELSPEDAADGERTARARARVRAIPRGEPPPRPVRTATPSPALAAGDGEALAARLRAMVGQRDRDRNDLSFAFFALEQLGATATAGELGGVDTGRALVALAREREALQTDGAPQLGDLVVFDHVEGGRPASLTGIVVTSDADGTIEFVYLARGVVRRGLVNLARPDVSRDEFGRALNTFVRHSDGRDRRGARYRAGELFSTFIRLDRLLRPGYNDGVARVVE